MFSPRSVFFGGVGGWGIQILIDTSCGNGGVYVGDIFGVVEVTAVSTTVSPVAGHCDDAFFAAAIAREKPRITTLVLEYLASNNESGAAYLDSSKWSYTTSVAPPASAYIVSDIGVVCGPLTANSICTLTALDGETFPDQTHLTVWDATAQVRQQITIRIHTSCAYGGIVVGDVFGSVRVAGISTTPSTAGPYAQQCIHTTPHHKYKQGKTKLAVLEFEYLATNSLAGSNALETDRWSYTPGIAPPASVLLSSSIGAQCGPLSKGGRCEMVTARDKVEQDLLFSLTDAADPSSVININVRAACKGGGGGIAVGDVFGSLKLVSLSLPYTPGPKGGAKACAGKGKGPKHHDRLRSVTLRYIGHRHSGQVLQSACRNDQGGFGSRWGFSTRSALPAPADAKIGASHHHHHRMGSAAANPLADDGTFTISSSTGKLSKTTFLKLYSGTEQAGEVFFNTDCHTPISPGDRFGFLEVVSLTTFGGSAHGCANHAGWRDTYTPICFPVDYAVEMGASGTAAPQNRVPNTAGAPSTAATTPPWSNQSKITGAATAGPGPPTKGNHSQPARTTRPAATTTTTPDFAVTATTDTNKPNDNDSAHAVCEVRLHKSKNFKQGKCSGEPIETLYPNASVGFASQICHTHKTPASGANTTLHITVQPVCKETPESEQVYRVCSWQPNALDRKCNAIPSHARQCCDNVAEKIVPPGGRVKNVGCQEYREGDCARFYGFNGTHAQSYRLEFVNCYGQIPQPFQCSGAGAGRKATPASKNGGRPGLAQPATGARADAGHLTAATGSIGLAGLGLIIIAAALRFRRKRAAQIDYANFAVEGAPIEPAETGPLLDNGARSHHTAANVGALSVAALPVLA